MWLSARASLKCGKGNFVIKRTNFYLLQSNSHQTKERPHFLDQKPKFIDNKDIFWIGNSLFCLNFWLDARASLKCGKGNFVIEHINFYLLQSNSHQTKERPHFLNWKPKLTDEKERFWIGDSLICDKLPELHLNVAKVSLSSNIQISIAYIVMVIKPKKDLIF